MSNNSWLDEFCGSTFWDVNKTWNSDNPEFTPCFQKTALVWIPCAYLWIAALLDIYYMLNSKEKNIPWNLLSKSKLFVTCLLVVVTLADIGVAINDSSQKEPRVPNADYYSAIIKILTFGLSATLLHYNRKFGMRASGVLFFFWLLLLLAGLPQLRSEITQHIDRAAHENVQYNLVSYVVYYVMIVIMFILNCFADLPPKHTPYEHDEKQCPENAAGIPSRLTFSWFDPMALTGFRKGLTDSDLWTLNPRDSCKEVVPRFDKYWEKALIKRENSRAGRATYSANGHGVNLKSEGEGEAKPASILPSICLAFGGQFLFGSLLKLMNDLILFLPPQLLRLLIGFVGSKEPLWRGYLYAVGLMVCGTIQTILLEHYFTRMYLVGMRIKTALTIAIYRKALRMSNAARKESTVGEIINLMSVDAHRFLDLTPYLNMVWSCPLNIVLAIYFLWGILGASVLAGVAVMVVLIPVHGLIAQRTEKLQVKQMKYKDERVKLMNEILNGIKVIKMYAWEPSFEDKVHQIRNKEMHVLKQSAYLNSFSSFIWMCAPFLVSLMSFGCFVLVNDTEVLDSKKAFVSLSLFNILRFPLAFLPHLISNVVQTSVAIKRLNKFMNSEELDQEAVEHNPKEPNAFLIEKGNFSWGEQDAQPVLRNISLAVGRGHLAAVVGAVGSGKSSLLSALLGEMHKISGRVVTNGESGCVIGKGNFSWGEQDAQPVLRNISLAVGRGHVAAVVGAVGSGKSSLLSALLGEMHKISGRVVTNGKVAYVAQQAWIQNATLQDNILFGAPLDPRRYARVLEACALTADLASLPGGDQTEIGEKGINLSGGQKQRVSLARAAYAAAPCYLLDDPLSAVDAHVGKHIFDQVIGPNGMLSHTTRIWVTHSVSHLAQADLVVVLKDGEISEVGPFRQLIENKGAFADLLLNHLGNTDQEPPEELKEITRELETHLGSEFQSRLQRARSLSESNSESDKNAAGDRSGNVKRQISESASSATAEERKEKSKLIEEEKTETGSVKWSVYKHYFVSAGALASVATLLMNLAMQALQVGSNYWLARWSDDDDMVVNGTVDTARRDLYLGVYGGLGVAQAITSFFGDLMPFLACWRASKLLHARLLDNVLKAPLEFFEVTPMGRILSRFSADVDVLDSSLPFQLTSVTSCMFEVVATLVVISLLSPTILAVVLPVALVYALVQRFYVATSRQLSRLEAVARSPVYSHFGETVTGASTIRAYGVTQRFVTECERGVDHNQACYYPGRIADRWLAVRLEMIGNVIIFATALLAVLGRDRLNPGLVGLSISYALEITKSLNWMVRMTSEVESDIVAVERIKEYTEVEQEAPRTSPNSPPAGWPQAGALRLEGVSLGYRGAPALHALSCGVAPRERVGIVGRTGAGKSTLTLGLFRIIEATEGKILLDGVDIATIGLHELRSRITIIPQDPVLFAGTLRMNLDPADAFSDAQIWQALEHAHLSAFVKGFPAGLLHEVSEGGENLSVGQRQLVCLARALLRKTPLLVLDEATAAVDLDTDDLIQRTIRSEFASCTVLTIAHRLHTIMDCARVLVLDRGRLEAFAPPAALLRHRDGIFYGMARDAGLVS